MTYGKLLILYGTYLWSMTAGTKRVRIGLFRDVLEALAEEPKTATKLCETCRLQPGRGALLIAAMTEKGWTEKTDGKIEITTLGKALLIKLDKIDEEIR